MGARSGTSSSNSPAQYQPQLMEVGADLERALSLSKWQQLANLLLHPQACITDKPFRDVRGRISSNFEANARFLFHTGISLPNNDGPSPAQAGDISTRP